MDPNVQNVLLGILTNGLTAFIAQIFQKDSQLLLGADLKRQLKQEASSLQLLLQQSAEVIAKDIAWKGLPSEEIVCLFLQSNEAETVIRQIYTTSYFSNITNFNAIREEFLSLFFFYTTSYPQYENLKKDELNSLSNFLLDTLIKGCEKSFSIAIDNGILAAHEAKSAFRHTIVLEEIAAIKENLAILTSQQKPNIQEFLDFEETYRRLINNAQKYIIPPNFGRAKLVPINKIYVSPRFITLSNKHVDFQDTVNNQSEKDLSIYKMTIANTFRAVILGNPGGGKSTFAKKLCYDLASKNSEVLVAGRKNITPVLVVLRDFGAAKKTRDISILDFIKLNTKTEYQVNPPNGAFEYLLLNGRLAIIFDGLDELLDTNDRQEISRNVNAFCALYPSVPVFVTSREVGYEQAPLDEERFKIFRLASFNITQIEDYVKKWFNNLEDLSPEQKNTKMTSFLKESSIVSDIRSNPLMLALLCNIYREENYIPRNRPDIYAKCANMLFERWDRSRGIDLLLPFESQIRPAMMYLAYWIYSSKELRGGVTERKLVEKTREYLYEKRYEDPDEAAKAAQEFIEFCKGRAWVFTNVGSTKDEELFQFTHTTFLEYFAAAYICRTHSTPAGLANVLGSRIAKREWDIVCQLAFQIQCSNVEGAGDELLISLIRKLYRTQGKAKRNFLSFSVRCLEFMIVNYKTLQEIVTACIDFSVEWSTNKTIRDKDYIIPPTIFCYLLNSAVENRRAIASYLEKTLIERIRNSNEFEAIIAWEISYSLASFYRDKYRVDGIQTGTKNRLPREYDSQLILFWDNITKNILDTCDDRTILLQSKCQLLSSHLYTEGKISIYDFTKYFGYMSIFSDYPYTLQVGTKRLSIYSIVVSWIFGKRTPIEKAIKFGKDVVECLISSPTPWVDFPSDHIATQGLERYLFRDVKERLPMIIDEIKKDKDAQFSILILLVILWDLNEDRKNINLTFSYLAENVFFKDMIFIIKSKKYKKISAALEEIIDNICSDETKKSIVKKWVKNEISIVG